MEMYLGEICITGTKLIISEDNPNGVMSEACYKSLRKRKNISVIERSCRGRSSKVVFNSLPQKYQDMWKSKNSDYEKLKSVGFADKVKRSPEVWRYFEQWTDHKGVGLEEVKIKEYSNNVAILEALKIERDVMTIARAKHGETLRGFWDYAQRLVVLAKAVHQPCSLPNTATTIKRKYMQYISEGLESMIHSNIRNNNSQAVKDTTAEAMLLELLANGNQLESTTIADTYNLWAVANNRKAITPRTVLNYLKTNEYKVEMQRKGKAVWDNKYDEVVKRHRPSAPLLMINSDDNDLDLYFDVKYPKIVKGKKIEVSNKWFRFAMYVVLDPFNDYILGYAISDEITAEVVYQAYKNAVNHVKELTGKRYLWQQIVTDRWQVKKLKPFYESMATFTPTAVKVARSKVIEASFGKVWHRELKRYSNYAGNNITAKHQNNPDYIQSQVRNRPSYEEGTHQVAAFVETMRHLANEEGVTRQQAWLDAFNTSARSKEVEMSDRMYLQVFGVQNKRQVTITNKGVRVEIEGVKYFFAVPSQIYQTAVGKSVTISYDPDDMSQVLCDDGKGLRFIAQSPQDMPMALADMKDGDRERLNAILTLKKQRKDDVIAEQKERQRVLDSANISVESLLQGGVFAKEGYYKATRLAQIKQAGGDTESIYDLI